MNRWSWLPIVLFAVACAEPPNKEMDQAQGALDAARAAGAERYASAEFTDATSALTKAHEAVGARDYRLALNLALESREQAQNAARVAAETRARMRGEVERAMAEVRVRLSQTRTQLEAARKAPRVQRRVLNEAASLLEAVEADVQEAGDAMIADDYVAAGPALEGIPERIAAVVAAIDAALPRGRR